jgi:hypothetical protein
MIPFFRKIRKKMADENKPLKYMRYAIGEIVLVVIGILIALQINTWNEARKDRLLETELLENLVENLKQNERQMEYRIRYINYFRDEGQHIIDIIDQKKPYHDSLSLMFHSALMNTSGFKLSNIGYEAIKNAGLEIIQNDSLKKEIMKFFEEIQPRFHIELGWGDVDKVDREKFIDEHFVQKVYKDSNSNRYQVNYIPFEPDKILKNHYFIALINKTEGQRKFFISKINDQKKENRRILNFVMEELQKTDL